MIVKRVLLSMLPPILLGLYFTLFLYSQNIDLVPYRDLGVPLVLSILVGLFLYGLAWIIFKSADKASLVSFLLVAMIFSYGYAHYASLALFGMVIVVILWLKIKRSIYSKMVLVLTVIVVSLVAVPSSTIAANVWNRETSGYSLVQASSIAKAPDIFYIILDSYAGEKDMQAIGFDNSDIYSYLKNQGFYVANGSFCNYPRTYLSLASSLNMSYLDKNGDVIDYTEACSQILDNQVVRVLKTNGYRYIHIGSETFLPTALNHNADENFEYKVGSPVYNEFSLALYGTSVFNWFAEKEWEPDLRQSERDAILYQLETLNNIARNNATGTQPTFTFCHILLPHHDERLFNADGTFPTGEQLNRSIEEDYVNKITYLNSRIKELVGNLLANKSNPPIVVLQGDEGISSTEFTQLTQNRVNQELQLTPDVISQRAYILNAVYLPAESTNKFYSNISPVNTFRIILNRYLGTSYDLLPDKFFFPKIYAGSGDGSPASRFYDATKLLAP